MLDEQSTPSSTPVGSRSIKRGRPTPGARQRGVDGRFPRSDLYLRVIDHGPSGPRMQAAMQLVEAAVPGVLRKELLAVRNECADAFWNAGRKELKQDAAGFIDAALAFQKRLKPMLRSMKAQRRSEQFPLGFFPPVVPPTSADNRARQDAAASLYRLAEGLADFLTRAAPLRAELKEQAVKDTLRPGARERAFVEELVTASRRDPRLEPLLRGDKPYFLALACGAAELPTNDKEFQQVCPVWRKRVHDRVRVTKSRKIL